MDQNIQNTPDARCECKSSTERKRAQLAQRNGTFQAGNDAKVKSVDVRLDLYWNTNQNQAPIPQ